MSSRNGFATSALDDVLLLFGRFAFAAIYLPSGFRKLMDFSTFAERLEPRGLPFGLALPFPDLLAVLAVAIEVVAPLMILLGIGTRWGALLLVAFTIMATLTSHRAWEDAAQTAAFYRNNAFIGGLLFLYVVGPGRLSLDYWLRGDRARASGASRASGG